jgi:hypothetical protein
MGAGFLFVKKNCPRSSAMQHKRLMLENWTVSAILKTGETLHLLDTAAFTHDGAIQAGWMNVQHRNLLRSVRHLIARPK